MGRLEKEPPPVVVETFHRTDELVEAAAWVLL